MRRIGLVSLLLVCVSAALHAQTFNIFAAASLKESAGELSKAFEKRHPTITNSLNFGGSQQLAAQIREGAPVDVLLSAGMEPLKNLEYDKSSLRVFAFNRLVLIVPAGSRRVKSVEDLNLGARLIFADPHVPVGNYTEQMLHKAAQAYGADWYVHVHRAIVSKEQDVRAVLTKIALGEADAGVVYATDYLTAKNKVRMIPIPSRFNVQAQYPAVTFKGSLNDELAQDFMRFLFEPEAQKILMKRGFTVPAQPKESKTRMSVATAK